MNELENQFDQATKDLPHSARDEYMAAFTKAAHGYAATPRLRLRMFLPAFVITLRS
jgi:hypothetical protein